MSIVEPPTTPGISVRDAALAPSAAPVKESLPAAEMPRERTASRGFVYAAAAMPLLVLFDQAIVSGGNFLTTVILGRNVGEAGLGVYRMGMSLVVVLISLPMSLVWTPYNVYSTQMKPRRRASYQSSVLGHVAVIAAVAAVSLLIVSMFVATELRGLFLSLAVVVAALLLREHARRMCFAQLGARDAVTLDATVTALQLLGLAGLVALGWLTGSRAFLAIGVACAIGLAVFPHLLLANRNAVWSRVKARADFLRNWQMSKYVFAGAVMYACSNGAYAWLLGLLHNESAVGRLAAAEGAIFLANPLLIAATNYFGPAMAHTIRDRGIDQLFREVVRYTIGLAAMMVLFCGVMWLFGGQIVTLIYGSKFSGLGTVVISLAVAQIVTMALIPLRSGLLALDQGHLMVKGGILRLICLATIGIAAVQTWGPLGVGVGMLSGDLAALVLKGWYLRRLMKTDHRVRRSGRRRHA